MRESRVELHLKRRVERAGGEIRKLVTPGRRHAPDRIVMWPGGHLHFVELKAPGKKPRPGQQREFARLEKLGHPVRILDTIGAVNMYCTWWEGITR